MQAQWPRPPFVGLWSRVYGFERARPRGACSSGERWWGRRPCAAPCISSRPRTSWLCAPPCSRVLDDGMTVDPAPEGRDRGHGPLVAKARAILARGAADLRGASRAVRLTTTPKATSGPWGTRCACCCPWSRSPRASRPGRSPTQARFALAEKWLGRQIATRGRAPTATGSILRYLAAYGPASVADAQAWSGVPGLRETLRSAAASARLLPRRERA